MNVNEVITSHLLELLIASMGILISVIIKLGTDNLSKSITHVSSKVSELSSEVAEVKTALNSHVEAQNNQHLIIERRVSSLEATLIFSGNHTHDSDGNIIYKRRIGDSE